MCICEMQGKCDIGSAVRVRCVQCSEGIVEPLLVLQVCLVAESCPNNLVHTHTRRKASEQGLDSFILWRLLVG